MKIVYFMTPAYGHILPVLPIIRELSKKYEVICYCTPAFRKYIAECGADYREYRKEFHDLKIDEVTSDLFVLMETLITLNEKLYDMYAREVFNELPDLLMYDSMLSFAKNIAYKLKIKSVCTVATIGFNLPVCMFSNIATSSIPLILKHGSEMKKLIARDKKFRKARGLRKFDLIDLYMNTADTTIVMTPEKLQPFSWTFSKSVHFTGPTMREQIEMLHGGEYEDYDYYISMGSVFGKNVNEMKDFFELPEIKEKRIIVSVPETPEWMLGMPNVRAEKWVYNVDLIPRCKVFINVGGVSSVYTAMYYGVRQISIPAQEEERYNAIIMKRHRGGIYLKEYDTDKLLKACRRIDAINPEKCRKIIRESDGTGTSVKLIEELIGE